MFLGNALFEEERAGALLKVKMQMSDLAKVWRIQIISRRGEILLPLRICTQELKASSEMDTQKWITLPTIRRRTPSAPF